jgi:hypothetical protein
VHPHSSLANPSAINNWEALRTYLLQLANAVQSLQADSNVFEGTLRANQTTSTFTHAEIGVGSIVIPIPTTSNAAGALTGLYQSTTVNGRVTFTHASTAATDKTFRFAIFGGEKPKTVTAT